MPMVMGDININDTVFSPRLPLVIINSVIVSKRRKDKGNITRFFRIDWTADSFIFLFLEFFTVFHKLIVE